MSSSTRLTLAVLIGLVFLSAPRTAGQAPTGGPDVLTELLAEVRGLRAAMEQMAASGPRVQLALGRLQLQEQRVNTLLRRLDEIRKELGTAQREQDANQLQLKMFGGAFEKADGAEREEAAGMAEQFKGMVAAAARNVQRLQEDEIATSQLLAVEQARWGDINRNLEELERSLGRR